MILLTLVFGFMLLPEAYTLKCHNCATLSKSNPNGKKCFTCNGLKCTETLNCEGNEDHCISIKVGSESIIMKGCASEQICANRSEIGGYVQAEINCCRGNLCNSASSSGAILPLLLAPLLASVIIS